MPPRSAVATGIGNRVARQALLDRAFGKPQTSRTEKEDSLATRLARMTPEERARDALELAERIASSRPV